MEHLVPSPAWFALAFLITALASGLQATVGFGFSLMSVPLLALIDPSLAPIPQMVCALPLGFAIFWRERGEADLRGVLWILIGRVPGAFLGLALLWVFARGALDLVLGVFVLVSVGLIGSGWKVPQSRWSKLGAGIASGTFAQISSIGGPPLALLYRERRGPTLRASLALVFCLGIVLNFIARALGGELPWPEVRSGILLTPALAFGILIGRVCAPLVEGGFLRTAVLWVAGLAGTTIIARAVW